MNKTDYPAAVASGEKANRAIAQEPLKLLVHIVKNELSYSEIITADYMMFNPFSALAYKPVMLENFVSTTNESEWKKGYLTINRTEISGAKYPHSGVLTSPIWLHRFPTTDTNRNRHRARMAYKQFLGVDLETLAQRTIDPAALMDSNNPTFNNPNCTVCHSVMDPVAGAFQDWGDAGAFRPISPLLPTFGSTWHALDIYYIRDAKDQYLKRLYKPGDLWYRDMFAPGFNGKSRPDNLGAANVAWLSQQFIQDARFAEGAAKLFFEGMTGIEPQVKPIDADNDDYKERLMAFELQQFFFKAWADSFRRDQGRGVMNIKDLLVDMAASKLFRAKSISEVITSFEKAVLGQFGMNRLLTPEQLNRKLSALTGNTWIESAYYPDPKLLNTFKLPYGGQDSEEFTERNKSINSLMGSMMARMSIETVCTMVVDDFKATLTKDGKESYLDKSKSERLLFPEVTYCDTPETEAGKQQILKNIQHLYKHLLGETYAINDVEVLKVYDLFFEIWSSGPKNQTCSILSTPDKTVRSNTDYVGCDIMKTFNSTQYYATYRDPKYAMRSWIMVLMYMLGDFKFLYE